MEGTTVNTELTLTATHNALIKAKLAVSKAVTISKEIDSLILVLWNAAEGGELDPTVYADVFGVMNRMSTELVSILEAQAAKDENGEPFLIGRK